MWFYLIFNVSHPKIRGFANTHQGKKPQHKITLPCFSPLSMDAEWTKNRKAAGIRFFPRINLGAISSIYSGILDYPWFS